MRTENIFQLCSIFAERKTFAITFKINVLVFCCFVVVALSIAFASSLFFYMYYAFVSLSTLPVRLSSVVDCLFYPCCIKGIDATTASNNLAFFDLRNGQHTYKMHIQSSISISQAMHSSNMSNNCAQYTNSNCSESCFYMKNRNETRIHQIPIQNLLIFKTNCLHELHINSMRFRLNPHTSSYFLMLSCCSIIWFKFFARILSCYFYFFLPYHA